MRTRLAQGPVFWMTVTVAYVAHQNDLRPEQLTGRDRQPRVVEARREAIEECRRLGYSTLQIGEFFGRHHTTILYALGRVA